MAEIRLSIILTTHLRPELVKRAIDSVIALGDGVQIVLCADEGSKPTRQMAADYLRDNDIFVTVPGLRGPSESRNLGLSVARGAYIGFLDDDDTLDQSLTTLLAQFDGKQVFYTNYRKIFETDQADGRQELRRVDKMTSKRDISTLLVRNFIPIGSFFAPRDAVKNLVFRSDLTSSEDWEFLINLYKSCPFQHVNIFGSNWHITESEASRDKVGRKVRARNCLEIYKHHPTADDAIQAQRINRLRELGQKEIENVL